ncbi:MAG: TIGR03663 family protein [Vicinamibacterales bacterium]|nr:TIGR03663 family protein [Vicinamibacterales bacterium]
MALSRIGLGCLVGLALAVALAFRLAEPSLRPMHHDEANQAVKFGALLETGEYRYDRDDHHGPTLYFLTLPAAWLRGQTTLASLDERTLRLVPALFGAGLLLLFLPLARPLGRPAVAAAAALAAISPVLTYYSRFYIQESLLVFFAVGFVVALGRYVEEPRGRTALAAGVCAGLAFATKETSVILLAAAGMAAVVARGGVTGLRPSAAHVAGAVAAAVAVAGLFYSSFFRDPAGVLESVLAFGTYVERGLEPARHAHAWDYYLRMLAWSPSGGVIWSEGLVLTLALAGIVASIRGRAATFWPRYLSLYTVMTAVVFSALAYKTPWNALSFHAGFVLLAGVGAAEIVTRLKGRTLKAAAVALLLAAAGQLALQDWRANFRYPADPRNPYVYAHTSTDFLRLVTRVADLSAVHPDTQGMLVKVVAGPYEQWPLPWYLRGHGRVGYWIRPEEAAPLAGTPVIIASQEQADMIGAQLGDAYVSEFYGLRPDVLLAVFIERGLWERFLETR